MTTIGTAIVTGASTGIGAVYADRLAKRGHDLVLVARNGARLEELAERLRGETGRTVEVLVADLTRSADVTRVEQRVAADDVTMLVNNAGMLLEGETFDHSAQEIETIIALNITALTRLSTVAGRAFAARGKGTIVNVASILGIAFEVGASIYSASKAFILSFSRALRRELAGKGVTVQVVLPGAVRTEIWERAGRDVNSYPPEIVMDAGDLVDAALAGLDLGEEVTIPSLADPAMFATYDAARMAMIPHLSRREPAERYR